MPLASLLHVPATPSDTRERNAYSFDHAYAHRGLFAVMGPLARWSLMPYFIDPMQYDARPATTWPTNHQQAHNDFSSQLPAYSQAKSAGIPTSKILVESNFADEGSLAWWTFNNHQEHLIAANAILPLPLTAADRPWWLMPPYLVENFW